MFTNKKRCKGLNTFVYAVSFYVVEPPKAPIKDHEPPLPIISFGIVAYGFVGQPFSKQLYTALFSLSLETDLKKQINSLYPEAHWVSSLL